MANAIYDLSTSTSNSVADSLQNVHKTTAKINRGEIKATAISVSTSWKGFACDSYLAKADALYSAMEAVEKDLDTLAGRIRQSVGAIDDLRSHCQKYAG